MASREELQDKVLPRRINVKRTAPRTAEKWPGWRVHPKTGQGRAFDSEDDVPVGWITYDEFLKGGSVKKAPAEPLGPAATPIVAEGAVQQETVDEEGQELRGEGHEADGDGGDVEADNEPEEIEEIDDLTIPVIKDRLDKRKVKFPASASKQHLYDLLVDNWNADESE